LCRWCCVQVVEVALCTCGVVHKFDVWCCVHVMLCTCCTRGVVDMILYYV